MTIDEYYTAPSDKVFSEIKHAAMEIWSSYDDTYGYATDKINRIKDAPNVKDNAWYIVSMFDSENVAKLKSMVSEETRNLITRSQEPN